MTLTCETKKFGTGEVTSCDVFQNAGTDIYLVPTLLSLFLEIGFLKKKIK